MRKQAKQHTHSIVEKILGKKKLYNKINNRATNNKKTRRKCVCVCGILCCTILKMAKGQSPSCHSIDVLYAIIYKTKVESKKKRQKCIKHKNQLTTQIRIGFK